jgi:hypothetical protein
MGGGGSAFYLSAWRWAQAKTPSIPSFGRSGVLSLRGSFMAFRSPRRRALLSFARSARREARVRAGAGTATNGAERRSVAEKRPGRGEAPWGGKERAR